MRKNILFSITLVLLISCKLSEKEKMIRLVSEWENKEILFPKSSPFTIYGKDTVIYPIRKTDYNVLVYTDSLGCTDCKLQLPKWKSFIKEVDSLASGKVSFLFYFHADNSNTTIELLRRNRFQLPICIDQKNELYKFNHFPQDITFQTFLLDQNNKVLIVGNPIHNNSIKKLYLKKITEK